MRNSFQHRYWETGFMVGAVAFAWKHDAWSAGIFFVGALAYVWYPFGKKTSRSGDCES
jgi:hypothetical protein